MRSVPSGERRERGDFGEWQVHRLERLELQPLLGGRKRVLKTDSSVRRFNRDVVQNRSSCGASVEDTLSSLLRLSCSNKYRMRRAREMRSRHE